MIYDYDDHHFLLSKLPAARFRSRPIGKVRVRKSGCEGLGCLVFSQGALRKMFSKKFFPRFGNQKRDKESEKGP